MAARRDTGLERYTQPAIRDMPRRFNVARDQLVAVSVGKARPRLLRWGLLAPWRGHGGKRPPPIYLADADVDAAARPPVLRRAAPCVVHADGFYAWRASGAKRQPYWIHPAPGHEIIGFAGLAATHADDGVESFAIVVAAAPPELADITPWAPVTVPAAVAWRATAITPYFTDVMHDDPDCIAPLGNPAQGELF